MADKIDKNSTVFVSGTFHDEAQIVSRNFFVEKLF